MKILTEEVLQGTKNDMIKQYLAKHPVCTVCRYEFDITESEDTAYITMNVYEGAELVYTDKVNFSILNG